MNPYEAGGPLCQERWNVEEYATRSMFFIQPGTPISGDALAVVRDAQPGVSRFECRFYLNGDDRDTA